MMEAGDITTQAILESLDLVFNSEATPECSSPDHSSSPSTSTNSSLSPTCTSSEDPPTSDNMLSLPHQITGSSENSPSPKSVECMAGLRTVSVEPPPSTWPAWQSLPTLSNTNDFAYIEPHHEMPPLFGTDLSDPGLFSGTGGTNIAFTASHYDYTPSVLFDDFSFDYDSIKEIRPSAQSLSIHEEYGFDPASPLSRPSLAETGEVTMMSSQDGFPKHIEYANPESISAGLQWSLPEAHSWQESQTSSLSTQPMFYSEVVTSADFTPTPTSSTEHSAPTLPLVGKSSHESRRGAYRRRRKCSGNSKSAKLRLTETQKREVSLEKNRRAAAKCRERRRSEIHQLKENSRASAVENSLLKQQTTQLRKEILELGSKLLNHLTRGECCRPEEVRMVLDERLERLYCEEKWNFRCTLMKSMWSWTRCRGAGHVDVLLLYIL